MWRLLAASLVFVLCCVVAVRVGTAWLLLTLKRKGVHVTKGHAGLVYLHRLAVQIQEGPLRSILCGSFTCTRRTSGTTEGVLYDTTKVVLTLQGLRLVLDSGRVSRKEHRHSKEKTTTPYPGWLSRLMTRTALLVLRRTSLRLSDVRLYLEDKALLLRVGEVEVVTQDQGEDLAYRILLSDMSLTTVNGQHEEKPGALDKEDDQLGAAVTCASVKIAGSITTRDLKGETLLLRAMEVVVGQVTGKEVLLLLGHLTMARKGPTGTKARGAIAGSGGKTRGPAAKSGLLTFLPYCPAKVKIALPSVELKSTPSTSEEVPCPLLYGKVCGVTVTLTNSLHAGQMSGQNSDGGIMPSPRPTLSAAVAFRTVDLGTSAGLSHCPPDPTAVSCSQSPEGLLILTDFSTSVDFTHALEGEVWRAKVGGDLGLVTVILKEDSLVDLACAYGQWLRTWREAAGSSEGNEISTSSDNIRFISDEGPWLIESPESPRRRATQELTGSGHGTVGGSLRWGGHFTIRNGVQVEVLGGGDEVVHCISVERLEGAANGTAVLHGRESQREREASPISSVSRDQDLNVEASLKVQTVKLACKRSTTMPVNRTEQEGGLHDVVTLSELRCHMEPSGGHRQLSEPLLATPEVPWRASNMNRGAARDLAVVGGALKVSLPTAVTYHMALTTSKCMDAARAWAPRNGRSLQPFPRGRQPPLVQCVDISLSSLVVDHNGDCQWQPLQPSNKECPRSLGTSHVSVSVSISEVSAQLFLRQKRFEASSDTLTMKVDMLTRTCQGPILELMQPEVASSWGREKDCQPTVDVNASALSGTVDVDMVFGAIALAGCTLESVRTALKISGRQGLHKGLEKRCASPLAGRGDGLVLTTKLRYMALAVSVGPHDVVRVNVESLSASSMSEQMSVGHLEIRINRQLLATLSKVDVALLDPVDLQGIPGDTLRRRSRSASWEEHQFDTPVVLTRGVSDASEGGRERCLRSISSGISVGPPVRDVPFMRRQQARRLAARERCEIDQSRAQGSPQFQNPAGGPDLDTASPLLRLLRGDSDMLSLNVSVHQVMFVVPHDEAPGRLIMYTELWSKAVRKALQPYLVHVLRLVAEIREHLKGETSPSLSARDAGCVPGESVGSPSRPLQHVELVVEAQHLVFKVEQHPLESWLALHAPILKGLSAQRQLLDRLIGTVGVQGSATQRAKSPLLRNALRSQEGSVSSEEDDDEEADGSTDDDSEDSEGELAGQGEGLGGGLPSPGLRASVSCLEEVMDRSDPGMVAWKQVSHDLFREYRQLCDQLKRSQQGNRKHKGALMHITTGRTEGVVMICLPSPANFSAAHSRIVRVDPASEGVPFHPVTQSISIDVNMTEVVAQFSGAEQVPDTCGIVKVSGLLVRARQLCAPPQHHLEEFPVGCWHQAPVPIVVKGTRPPMKMYTDLKVEIEEVQGGYCAGLEPSFGQLGMAFKRLQPPVAILPDGSVPPSTGPSLPWWDAMRYMWRGQVSLMVRQLTAVMAQRPTMDPQITLQEPRLKLTATTLGVHMAAGRIEVTSTDIDTVAYCTGPDSGPSDPMLLLPIFHLPMVTLVFNISVKLPGGRDPLHHHIFPIGRGTSPGDAVQPVVDMFSQMKCEGWGLAIDINVASDGSFGPKGMLTRSPPVIGVSSSPTRAPQSGHLRFFQPYTVPHVYIGEFQVDFVLKLVGQFINPHPVLRLSRKPRSFYSKRVRAVGHGITPMPLLMQKVDVGLAADVFHIHHDAQDPDDPSDMVYLTLCNIRYANSFTYQRFHRSIQLSTGTRQKLSNRQFMKSLSVDAYNVRIIKPGVDRSNNGPSTSQGHSRRGSGEHLGEGKLRELMDPWPGGHPPGARARTPGSPQKIRTVTTGPPGFGDGLIVSATCFLLRQVPPEQGSMATPENKGGSAEETRQPIRMTVEDVRLLCPAALRDTCVLMFMHMFNAFGHLGVQPPWAGSTRKRYCSRTNVLGTGTGTVSGGAVASVQPAGAAKESGCSTPPGCPARAQTKVMDEGALLDLILRQNEVQEAETEVRDGPLHRDGTISEDILTPSISHRSSRVTDDLPMSSGTSPLEAVDLGQLEYEVQFKHVQVNLMSSAGNLLLGTNSALLQGHLHRCKGERNVTFQGDEVQALIGDLEVDPGAGPPWLEMADGKLMPLEDSPMRQVLKPFKAHLLSSQLTRLAPFLADRPSQELLVQVPEIQAIVDSREFDILMDVIQNIALAPFPQPMPRMTVPQRDRTDIVDDDRDVHYAWETVQSLYENLRSMQHEEYTLRCFMDMYFGTRSLFPLAVAGQDRGTAVGGQLVVPPEDEDTIEAAQQLVISLARSNTASQHQALPGASSLVRYHIPTILRWGQDQVLGAQDSIEASYQVLDQLRREATLIRVQQRASMLLEIRVNKIAWALTKNNIAFVTAELQGVAYQSARDKDHSGTSKFTLCNMWFRDGQTDPHAPPPMGLTVPVAGTILAPWKPDASWSEEEMLRMYVVHGPLKVTHSTYEHLEVLLHPLVVYLTWGLAQALQDYFQLAQDEVIYKRQEEFQKTIKGPSGSGKDDRRRVTNDRLGSGPDSPTTLRATRKPGENYEWDVSPDVTSRLPLWDEEDYLEGGAGFNGFKAHEGSVTRYSFLKQMRRERSSVPGERRHLPALQAPTRTIKFKHVRINRMTAHITYEGYPISLTNLGLVLDARVYQNMEGSWKVILNRYKWDVLRSIVKSVTGLQAKKFEQLKIPTFADDTLDLKAPSGFKLKHMFKPNKRGRKGKKVQGADITTDDGEDGGGDDDGAQDYLQLMRDAIRQKQKQFKLELLLGHVPPLCRANNPQVHEVVNRDTAWPSSSGHTLQH